MEGENKCTYKLFFFLNYMDEKASRCEMSSCCGLAVELMSPAEGADFILCHWREERNPREETSVKQGKEALQS